ncbi:trimeric intracellular cation channel family protein [Symbioplanes lichenis]|uniref:trimeric intracellular cation channel family protein n=1 Tax=Symbioplanes lichenis TaxID=1629072 RepID=UPI002738A78E|nr:trimeric intracellular cation channel family protein [Actinoplanes lichenis]
MSPGTVVTVLELVGLSVFAASGALMAISKEFDVVGIVVLALLTALGGGVLRDVIIGATPPAAFSDVTYLLVPLSAAAVCFFAHPLAERLRFTMLVFDAAGLGLFAVTGTLKALGAGLGSVQAVLLGVTTAVGGGALRDIFARETPAVVQVHTDLYAIPAATGAVLVAAAHPTPLPLPVVAVTAAVLVFAFRLAAMTRHWKAPQAWHRKA